MVMERKGSERERIGEEQSCMTSIDQKSVIVMQIKHFLNVENSYTASHYEITLQQKIGWLENVIQKAPVHKGVDGRDTVSVTMGGSVHEMTVHAID